MKFLDILKDLFNPHEKERIYSLDCDFFIHVLDHRDLNKLHKDNHNPNEVHGFTIPRYDVYVAYDYTKKDAKGKYLPRFETLGHEIWHKIDRGFHK